jgi:hypothetical protein
MRGASGLAKNEAHHNRSHTTGNPKQLTLLKMRCQVWRHHKRQEDVNNNGPMPPMSARAPSRRQDVRF